MPITAADQLDDGLSIAELIHAAGYTQRVRGAADYRLLQLISRIHEHREDQHIAQVAARAEQNPPAEASGIAAVLAPRDKYGPDGLERAIGDIGAELCVTPQRARRLIAAASAARYRLPETARALAEGFIDLDRMTMVVTRTDLVGSAEILRLDRELATAIFHRGPMSTQRFRTLVDRLIHKHDPDAVRRRAARTDENRNITIAPDRFATGQARISGSLPHEQAAVINARLDAMAKEVHRGDGRTLKQRRADAYVALARGLQHLCCHCDDCNAAPGPEPAPIAAPSPTEPAATSDTAGDTSATPQTCSHPTTPLMYVVVNLSTLLGLDNDPAYLDGQGLVDADTARALLAEAKRAYIAPSREDPAAERRYRPSRKLRALLRAGELCCQFPGCNAPVSQADLDHHHAHGDGGRTTPSNIGPLCRFHHRLKTFEHWRQYQDTWHTTVFTSPDGLRYVGNAYNGLDIFDTICREPVDRPPEHPTRSRFDQRRNASRARRQRAQQKWEKEHPPPF
ncbi:HNH endonuclease signature motif containing protein [Jongsikchunia kroppenstedtii]|uniref:HNH endonuclease signature motif containing protein n=1 Tax=Jongsikchunia kroppenstedtii TaxID=1121721 RepID=UPI000367C6C7|nr:HNH endonuclease signature motif containing protein [Jongsikchunia kroppenstedtii]